MALPIVAAAAPLIGDVLGGLFGSSGQASANAANAALAQKQMDFQKEMSSTAYQRAVADMKAAGLNPMLAYQQGGASTPQGAMATMQNTGAAIGSGIQEGVSSAMSALQLREQLANIHADTLGKEQRNMIDAKELAVPDDAVERAGGGGGATYAERRIQNALRLQNAQSANLLALQENATSAAALNRQSLLNEKLEFRTGMLGLPAAKVRGTALAGALQVAAPAAASAASAARNVPLP